MRTSCNISAKQYTQNMRDSLSDSLLGFGREQFNGVVIGRFFHIRYSSGNGFGRRYWAVFNSAMGVVRDDGQGCRVHTTVFRGLADPLYVVVSLLASLLVFSLAGAPAAWLFALGWTAATSLFTFAFTAISNEGRQSEQRLRAFIENP